MGRLTFKHQPPSLAGKVALVVAVTALFVAAVACDPDNPSLRLSQNGMIRLLFGGNATELSQHTDAEIEASAAISPRTVFKQEPPSLEARGVCYT